MSGPLASLIKPTTAKCLRTHQTSAPKTPPKRILVVTTTGGASPVFERSRSHDGSGAHLEDDGGGDLVLHSSLPTLACDEGSIGVTRRRHTKTVCK
jgi:hypothetical protein